MYIDIFINTYRTIAALFKYIPHILSYLQFGLIGTESIPLLLFLLQHLTLLHALIELHAVQCGWLYASVCIVAIERTQLNHVIHQIDQWLALLVLPFQIQQMLLQIIQALNALRPCQSLRAT